MALIPYCFFEGDTVRQHIINGFELKCCCDERPSLKATTGLMSTVCVWSLIYCVHVCVLLAMDLCILPGEYCCL